MSKTNEQILEHFYINPKSVSMLSAMSAAREDEREMLRAIVTNDIFFLSDKSDSKNRWAINRLKKILDQIK